MPPVRAGLRRLFSVSFDLQFTPFLSRALAILSRCFSCLSQVFSFFIAFLERRGRPGAGDIPCVHQWLEVAGRVCQRCRTALKSDFFECASAGRAMVRGRRGCCQARIVRPVRRGGCKLGGVFCNGLILLAWRGGAVGVSLCLKPVTSHDLRSRAPPLRFHGRG